MHTRIVSFAGVTACIVAFSPVCLAAFANQPQSKTETPTARVDASSTSTNSITSAPSTKAGSQSKLAVDSNKPAQAFPVPEATSGQVEIKELKATMAVDVLASHSKVFKTKQKIKRVAVSDPTVADVVLMTENQFCVIGKNPGNISVTVWCESSN